MIVIPVILLLALSIKAHEDRSFTPILLHRTFEIIDEVPSTSASNSQVPFLVQSNNNEDDLIEKASALAVTWASRKLKLDPTSFQITNAYTTPHLDLVHVYLQQIVKGHLVANGFCNVNVKIDTEKIVSFGSSFHQSPATAQIKEVPQELTTDILSPSQALASFAKHLKIDHEPLVHEQVLSFMPLTFKSALFSIKAPFTLNPVPAFLSYIQSSDDELLLVWDMEVEMENNWFHAHVDAVSGEVISKIDWVSDSKYNVFPLGTNDPNQGKRNLVKNPENSLASPQGWVNGHTTQGNNAYAQENEAGRGQWKYNHRPEGSDKEVFDFAFDRTMEPKEYLDAAITNLFYWVNIVHDLMHVYGFNEVAGNFQIDNFGKGGLGNDAVIANAQDGSGYNNANFATPPDGRNGKMRMYIWDEATPMRDGDLEAGIIVHEYAHGISTRLTGGSANSGCLGWGESGGMGEGWGDFFSTILQHSPTTKRSDDFAMGEYSNNGHGIRKYIYSSSMKTNPSTYGFISHPGYYGVHAKGEVWAAILLEPYWELVTEFGFSPDWYKTPAKKGKHHKKDEQTTYLDILTGEHVPRESKHKKRGKIHGNSLMLQLVIDGMKLQPCYPSFVDARDAIIQADKHGFKGRHECALWKGFAKRGLGYGARSGGRESFEVPKKCKKDSSDDEL